MAKLAAPNEHTEYFTFDGACAFAGLSQWFMRNAIQHNKIDHYRLPNGHIRLAKADLVTLMASMIVQPGDTKQIDLARKQAEKLTAGKRKRRNAGAG